MMHLFERSVVTGCYWVATFRGYYWDLVPCDSIEEAAQLFGGWN